MGGTLDSQLEALCRMASDAARSQGHDIDGWERAPGSEGVAATATCRRCGRAVHVRTDGALKGAAGRALTEGCAARGP